MRLAHAERVIRSVKSEYLDKLVLLGEHHLRSTVLEFASHYHTERNYQGIDSRIMRTFHLGLRRVARLPGAPQRSPPLLHPERTG